MHHMTDTQLRGDSPEPCPLNSVREKEALALAPTLTLLN